MKMKKTKNIKTSKGFSTITSNDDLKLTSITPHAAPIFASSTYVYESAEKAQRVFEGKEEAFIYSRWSHPNAELVEKKLEDLETYGTDTKAKALVFSSGMSALSALFQSVLKPGDTLLAQ